jgi:ABC-type nitrate/sulfonate/bicarbonate transport system substrate-binding protein
VRCGVVSSGNDAPHNREERLTMAPGHGALVAVPVVGSAFQHLPPGADNLLVVSSTEPREVAEPLEAAGIDLTKVGMVPVSGSAVAYDGPLTVSEPVVPDDLTGLSIRFTEALSALESGRGWVVLEGLNVLLLYADEQRTVRFLDHVAATAGDRDLRTLFCVARDAMEERTYENLRRRVDAEIDLR